MTREKSFNFQEFSDTYKGGVSAGECRALARYARELAHGCVVEIGSFRGKSAVALAYGLDQRAGTESTALYCIEPHRPFVGVRGGEFGPHDRAEFYRLMLDSGYADRVSLINLPSVQAAAGWQEPIGLLFIDGDHRYPAVRADFCHWAPHVVEGGVIALDDTRRPELGPTRLVTELLGGTEFEHIETVEKITFLRKRGRYHGARRVRTLKRVLLACHELALSGGMLRFERFGREITKLGHEFAYLPLGEPVNPPMQTRFEVLTLADASARQWDVTMVPGQGFPPVTRRKLADLRAENFGYRVQHILNDRVQPHLIGFRSVNEHFRPDLVVFNNRHWPPGSFTELMARKFMVIEGAVDPIRFAPPPGKPEPPSAPRTVIGSLAKKNSILPLMGTIRGLPDGFVLKLFGRELFGKRSDLAAACQDLLDAGRVQFVGTLGEDELPGFYHACDVVLHAEDFAGWANVAAEAMACGVPVVCTRNGTLAFAVHEETALVVDQPEPAAFVAAIRRLVADPELARRLAGNARRRIAELSWGDYATRLMDACVDDRVSYYTCAPELGLFGKWPPADRLAGLEQLLARCAGLQVLDLGSAEGVVAREFLRRGASLVHGFELEPRRVELAREVCAEFPAAVFRRADVSDWDAFAQAHSELLLGDYDVVLYLGVHHHLAITRRVDVLRSALRRARRFFAMRTPAEMWEAEELDALIKSAGFDEFDHARPALATQGELRVYQRCR